MKKKIRGGRNDLPLTEVISVVGKKIKTKLSKGKNRIDCWIDDGASVKSLYEDLKRYLVK